MWSPRQVTHLPPVWDVLLLKLFVEDRREQWLLVSHIQKTQRYAVSNVESHVFTPNTTTEGNGGPYDGV